jgi:hypothetical protein
VKIDICDDRVLVVDKRTYLELPSPVEKDYEYVITLSNEAADMSFYEEMSGMGVKRYATHTEKFQFPADFTMTSRVMTMFVERFLFAWEQDKVDIRKAVKFAVKETASYVSQMPSVV